MDTNAPFGLRAVYHPSGQVRAYQLAGGISSAYAQTLLQGQPVKLSGGYLAAAAVGDAFVGAFEGCQYADPATGRTIITNRWLLSTSYVAGSMIASFYRDPGIVYEVQSANTIDQTMIGDQTNFTSSTTINAGNTTTGLSSATISAATTTTGTQAQVEIMDIAPYANNAWGDQYPIVRVTISLHQDVAAHNSY